MKMNLQLFGGRGGGSSMSGGGSPAPQRVWNNFANYVEDEYGSINDAAEMLYEYGTDVGLGYTDAEMAEMVKLANKVRNRTATTEELQKIVDDYL